MPWQRAKIMRLIQLLNHKKPELRWTWVTHVTSGKKSLRLRSPRCVEWDFKLNCGCFIRRVETKPCDHPTKLSQAS